MIKNAVLGIDKTQKELDVLREKFDSFRNNGHKLTTSKLGTWILKSFNYSDDSDFKFNGLGISAEYQFLPLGKSEKDIVYYSFMEKLNPWIILSMKIMGKFAFPEGHNYIINIYALINKYCFIGAVFLLF